MVQMDITKINREDETFDVVLCSHVLEHIPDDRKAISEIYRVLKTGGWALLQVPILRVETDEDPEIQDPLEREKRFGQHDHVRACGTDYPTRFEEAGFIVESYPASEVAGSDRAHSWGLLDLVTPSLFLCHKV
jgi:SAM-dependent methyltransferase